MERMSEDCSICWHGGGTTAHLVTLACNHSFHVECLSNWLRVNPTCPYCMRVAHLERLEDNAPLRLFEKINLTFNSERHFGCLNFSCASVHLDQFEVTNLVES
jgi:hypothetical protein